MGLGLQPLVPTSKKANPGGGGADASDSLIARPGGRLSAQAMWELPSHRRQLQLTRAQQEALESRMVCAVCGGGEDEKGNDIMLCENRFTNAHCSHGCHLKCHDPPLLAIPRRGWFCPVCDPLAHGRKRRPVVH